MRVVQMDATSPRGYVVAPPVTPHHTHGTLNPSRPTDPRAAGAQRAGGVFIDAESPRSFATRPPDSPYPVPHFAQPGRFSHEEVDSPADAPSDSAPQPHVYRPPGTPHPIIGTMNPVSPDFGGGADPCADEAYAAEVAFDGDSPRSYVSRPPQTPHPVAGTWNPVSQEQTVRWGVDRGDSPASGAASPGTLDHQGSGAQRPTSPRQAALEYSQSVQRGMRRVSTGSRVETPSAALTTALSAPAEADEEVRMQQGQYSL